MLAELVGEDGGVEPVEAQLAPVHHVHQRVQHLRLLARLVAETEVLAALDEAQRLDVSSGSSASPSSHAASLRSRVSGAFIATGGMNMDSLTSGRTTPTHS